MKLHEKKELAPDELEEILIFFRKINKETKSPYFILTEDKIIKVDPLSDETLPN